MAGDPSNAKLWAEADVFIAFDTDEANPADADTAFGSGWDLVGLLDGDEGFTESRDEDVTDHFAWGGILMKTGRKNFKLTRTFIAFEHNEVTRQLRWPGSDPGELKVPRPVRVKIAFETREGSEVHRVISRYQAEVTVNDDITENESDPAALPFLVTIFPDDDGVLFDEQSNVDAS